MDHQIERAAKIISEARNPIVLAGNAWREAAQARLCVISLTRSAFRVVETFMGKGSLPDAHPLCLGTGGSSGSTITFHAVSVGPTRSFASAMISSSTPRSAGNPRRDKRIVHIDPSPAEVDAAYQVAVGVQARLPSR